MTSTEPATAARATLDLIRAGRFVEVRETFAPHLRRIVTPEQWWAAWTAEVGPLGAITTIGLPVSAPVDDPVFRSRTVDTLVTFPVTFAYGEATVLVTVTEPGWVVGIQLIPAAAEGPAHPWEPPAYADPGTLHEYEVRLGRDLLAVSGTVTAPRIPGPYPAAVLLPDAGPLDRDGTTGPAKPLKDLAWGLATRGVVVLRFDKVQYSHGPQVDLLPDFDVDDEYTGPGHAAMHWLGENPNVDPARLFVLGHGLGGTVAPRVAATGPVNGGAVIVAGDARPPADLPFGDAYRISLEYYDAPLTAAAMGNPALILHTADGLIPWRAAGTDATFRVCDDPTDSVVVADIATWLIKTVPR